MTDGRNPSPSDELLDRARGHVVGSDTEPGEFVPTSPADTYAAGGVRGTSQSSGESTEPTRDGEALSAEDIAAELLEAQTISAPTPTVPPPVDPSSDRQRSEAEQDQATLLPDWAIGESAPPPMVPHEARSVEGGSPPSTSDVVGGVPASSGGGAPVQLDEPDNGVQDRWTTPTSEWEAYEAQRAARKAQRLDVPVPRISLPISGRVVGALIGLAIFGISFLVNHFDGKEAVADAAIGDCFIVGAELEIDQVPVVDCSKKHDSELFARVSMVELGAVYPNEDLAFDWLFDECVDRFPSYVGEPYETSAYWIDMLIPTADGWADGDHTGLCTIVVMDGEFNAQMTTGSARGSANNA